LISKARLESFKAGSDAFESAQETFKENLRIVHDMAKSGADAAQEWMAQAVGNSTGSNLGGLGGGAADDDDDSAIDADTVVEPADGPYGRSGKSMVSSSSRGARGGGKRSLIKHTLHMWKVNSAYPMRVRQCCLADAQMFLRPNQEIAVSSFVQQLLSGVMVTRVAIMTVYPSDE
jgi:hypothetical protein